MNDHNYGYWFLRKSLFSHHTYSDEDKVDLSVNMVGDQSLLKKQQKKHSTTTSSSTWSLQPWMPHSYILILNSDLILNSIGFNPSSKVRNKSAFRKVETDVKVLRMLTEEHVYKHF